MEAVEYAEQTSGKLWEFAIEIEQLTYLGLNSNDFRWLVRNELVEHQCEVTQENEDGRTFRPSGDLTFPNRTCFVLTSKAITTLRNKNGSAVFPQLEAVHQSHASCRESTAHYESVMHSVDRSIDKLEIKPSWDSKRRLLRVNETIVKRFRWGARNQEAILSAFEEDGWPPRIDDPLSPIMNQDSKRRLNDTIKYLNRNQEIVMLRFRGDGTGEGIIWEPCKFGIGASESIWTQTLSQ
jgi:hypothetical protein